MDEKQKKHFANIHKSLNDSQLEAVRFIAFEIDGLVESILSGLSALDVVEGNFEKMSAAQAFKSLSSLCWNVYNISDED